jgi:hypothetical protein
MKGEKGDVMKPYRISRRTREIASRLEGETGNGRQEKMTMILNPSAAIAAPPFGKGGK